MKKTIAAFLILAGCGSVDSETLAPPGRTVPNPTLSGQIVPPHPSQSTIVFSSDKTAPGHQTEFSLAATPQIYAWIYMADVQTAGILIINWHAPDGSVFQSSSELLINTGSVGGVSFQDMLPVAGGEVAHQHMTGHWSVEAILDDGTGIAASFLLTE